MLEEQLFKTILPAEEVAAIIVEPVQGEGGYLVPPKEFHQELRRIADKYGILLIHDEVQCGMGRTGRMFASEHFGVAPDIVTLAKGIASGMPLSATIARADIMNWPPGAHASTFGGNPVSIASALATLDLLEESLVANSEQIGCLHPEAGVSLARTLPPRRRRARARSDDRNRTRTRPGNQGARSRTARPTGIYGLRNADCWYWAPGRTAYGFARPWSSTANRRSMRSIHWSSVCRRWNARSKDAGRA